MPVGYVFQNRLRGQGHVDSYSLSVVLNPRDALYGGCYETFAFHDQSTDRSVTSVRATTIPYAILGV